MTRLEVSDNHPLWVQGHGWVESAKLQRGMKLQAYDKSIVTVANVADLGREAPTFNLTVADYHTFFAGESKAFVHNACACGFSARGAAGYSVAFETTIAKAGAGTRASHFADANASLLAAMKSDASFAKTMEDLGVSVGRMDRSPANWNWHHVADQPGVMQLVPRAQHQAGSFQSLLHPDGVGGFKLWGADY